MLLKKSHAADGKEARKKARRIQSGVHAHRQNGTAYHGFGRRHCLVFRRVDGVENAGGRTGSSVTVVDVHDGKSRGARGKHAA